VAVDGSGKIYIADQGNHRIRVIDKGQVSTFAGSGQAGFTDGPAANAMFKNPTGVAVDGSGRVLVADQGNHRVRVVYQGQVNTLAGNGQAGFADGPVADASFNAPTGVTVDASGKVLVADRNNHRVRLVDKGQVSTLAGTGQPAYVNGASGVAAFNQPSGVAVNGYGVVYVADLANHSIRMIAP
jgi:sugar lactone lactonase YvrE